MDKKHMSREDRNRLAYLALLLMQATDEEVAEAKRRMKAEGLLPESVD